MPELPELFASALDHNAARVSDNGHGGMWHAKRSIARKRALRATASVAGAFLTVAAVGAGALAAAHLMARTAPPATTAGPTPSVTPSATPSPSATPPAYQSWADVPDDARPPMLVGLDPRESPVRAMEPWVWDLVDGDWTYRVEQIGVGEGAPQANRTSAPAIQSLNLVAPDGDEVRVMGLPTTSLLHVELTIPEQHLLYLVEYGYGDFEGIWYGATIQVNAGSAEVDDNWTDGAITLDPGSDGKVTDVLYVGRLSNGNDLWVRDNAAGLVRDVFWRTPSGEFVRSAVNDEFTADGASMSVDVAAGVATYRANGNEEWKWLKQDLVTDVVSSWQPLLGPNGWCDPTAVIEGDYVVMQCAEWSDKTAADEIYFKVYLDGTTPTVVYPRWVGALSMSQLVHGDNGLSD